MALLATIARTPIGVNLEIVVDIFKRPLQRVSNILMSSFLFGILINAIPSISEKSTIAGIWVCANASNGFEGIKSSTKSNDSPVSRRLVW